MFWENTICAVATLLLVPQALFSAGTFDTNNSPSLEELGEKYYYGNGVPKDLDKSFDCFRQAAGMGSSRAQSWVGYLYQTGQGAEMDYEEAFHWTKMAAEQGRAFDANRLAGYYRNGFGTKINKEEALRWLKTAAEKGDENARKDLPVWTATWQQENKQNLKTSSETCPDPTPEFVPALWRVAGPWKFPAGDRKDWFEKLSFQEVANGLANGSKSRFLGEERNIVEVQAAEANDLAKSLGTYANRIALAQGCWTADQAGKALLAVGTDDAVKIWVNGKLTVCDWVARNVTSFDNLYSIDVQNGVNQIHAVILNFKGPWGFFLHLPDSTTRAKLLAQSVSSGEYDRTRTLLEAGVDPRQQVGYRLPALELAQVMKRTYLENLLRLHGAKESLLAWSHYPLLVKLIGPWFVPKNLSKPGHGFLLARHGKIFFENYSGLANVENRVPIGPETKFAIGSISKQFVSAAMLRMQEEGKLMLTDPVSKYLSGFPRGKEITLRQLLTHTSGIREYTCGDKFESRCGNSPAPGEILQMIESYSYGDRAGRRFSYSNSNYYLAGLILEKVTGEDLGQLLDRLFFTPLGMKNTKLARGGAVIDNYATPYILRDGQTERANSWNLDWIAGAGGIVSTPRDLFLWNEALWNGKILTPESRQEAFRPEATDYSAIDSSGDGYGCGWGSRRALGHPWIGHGGYIPPYRASLWRVPDLDVTVVAMTNAGASFSGLDPESMSVGAVCFFFNREVEGTVRDEPAANLADSEISERVGLYDDGISCSEINKEGAKWVWEGGGTREELRVVGARYFVGKHSGRLMEILKNKQGHVAGIKVLDAYFPFYSKKLPQRAESESFNQAHIRDFLGNYDFVSYGSCQVSEENGHLFLRMTNQAKIPMKTINRDEFEVLGVGARFFAERDMAGNVTRTVFRQHGMTIEAPKTH